MFQAQSVLFVYCVSPVHMGAGTALGLIDNPIQREKHTDHPLLAGSGLKGAIRHRQWGRLPATLRQDNQRAERRNSLLCRLFGPESGDSDNLHAGAISFGDAQLVAFPVRCARNAFVYATSPTALARARRLLALSGVAAAWSVPTVADGQCCLVNRALLSGQALHLEAFEFPATVNQGLMQVSEWLSANALPDQPEYAFFRDKLKHDLVLLPDEEFSYFVRNATVVEPHVRIDNETGAAADTGLFYTENLPPESLLIAPLLASVERSGRGTLSAEDVLAAVLNGKDDMEGINGALVQVGGDATTGRGQVVLTVVRG